MPNERQRRIRELFDAVHEMDAVAQQDFLVRNCAGDHELAGAVWKLLLARNRSAGILDTPVVRRQELSAEPAQPGMRIGPYKIFKKLDGGGMGVVYQAFRADEVFQRISALKVIRPEFVHSSLIENFYAERQILAKLDHPNIARIIDGGTTADGLPYFVMDLVDGVPLHAFCSEKGLSVHRRLKLFRQVCAAVDYLHKNGVIHCDLKPSNMLVDKDGTVKLLDFGIAQLGGSAKGEGIVPLMTPGYSSPEQLRGQPPTPASDVYSLGITLYELLSGRRPFENKTTQELITAVTTREPMPPSAAASLAPSKIGHIENLKGDLDCIVLKAIQREPAARYTSASALSEDIENYLRLRPVQASRGGLPYRFAKLFRRHARQTVAASLVALLIGVLGWQTFLLRQRYQYSLTREHALEQKLEELQTHLRTNQFPSNDSAGGPAADLRSLANAYQTSFSDAVRVWPGMDENRRRLLNGTSTYLMDSAPRVENDPPGLKELVNAWVQVANVEGNPNVPNLGDKPAARQALHQAASTLETLASMGTPPSDLLDLESLIRSGAQALDSPNP